MKSQTWIAVVLALAGAVACSNTSSKDGSAPAGESHEESASGPSLDAASRSDGERAASRPTTTPGATPTPSTPTNAGSAGAPSGASAASPPAAPAATPPGSPGSGQAFPPMRPPSPDDRFQSVGTNPFVLAAHDPFSTFAADVDTASYDIFRQQIELNALPVPAAIRVEDFVNYFAYAYPAPAADAEHPFSISLAAAPNAFGRETTLLRVGIQAENPPPLEKKPTNLVFLVDTSGSMMSPEKLPLVQSVIKHGLDVLAAEDKVSIVTYSAEALVQLPPTAAAEKAEITAVVDGLYAAGSTNGAGGIQLAYEQAQGAFLEGGINHVILCTDGDFNVGISDTNELVEFIEEKRETGITLTALGFGSGNLNDVMMEKVSNAGNGIYSVISTEAQATRYAEDRMLRTLMHVAKDLKIQLEFNPEQVEAYRLIGYENRAIADDDFRDDRVDAGEVGAGHRVTALYELVRKGDDVPQSEDTPYPVGGDPVTGAREVTADDLVLVKVRYKAPGAAESDAAKEVVNRLAPSAIGALFDQADEDLRWAAGIAAFAEILKKSPYATPTQLSALREVFAALAERDSERMEFLMLFDKASTLLPDP
jgi:Ca-activated chloride channel family protein